MLLKQNPDDIFNALKERIKTIVIQARQKVFRNVNIDLLLTYWEIGKTIIEVEQEGGLRAQYGKQLLIKLTKQLTKELGKGFSRSNLQNMRNFYNYYPNCQTVSGELSWSHYCELFIISDNDKRAFYEKESINSNLE